MATTTTNLGLTKPAYTETADISVINSNMDTIDSAIKTLQDTTSTHTSQISALQDSVGHKLFYSDHNIDTLISGNYKNDIYMTHTSVMFETQLAANEVKSENVTLANADDDSVQDTYWPLAVNGYLVSFTYNSRTQRYTSSLYNGSDVRMLRCAPWWYGASGNYMSGVQYGVANVSNSPIEANTIGVMYYITWIKGEVGIFT